MKTCSCKMRRELLPLNCFILILIFITSFIQFPTFVSSIHIDKFRGVARSDNYGGKTQYPEFPPRPRTFSGSCDQVINQEVAWFASPNYPLNYDSNMMCTYTIEKSSPNVCQIEFIFEDFDLEDSLPSCDADYLEVAPRSRLCGSLIPDFRHKVDIPPGQSSLRVTFRTNHRKNKKGFMGRIRQITNSCDGGIYRSGPSGDDGVLPMTGIKPYNHRTGFCDAIVTGYSGNIRSPDYPLSYPSNSVCAFTIKRPSPDVCKVELVLRKFDVRGTSGEGCKDYLELPDRRKLCGIRSETVTIEYSRHSDYTVLIFRSDYESSAPGFDIDVRQIPASCIAISKARKCDQTLTGYNSRIMSPNYPWSYMPDTFCMYMIEAADSRMCFFTLEFNKFELDGITGQTDSLCTKDYFQLPDGHRVCSSFTGNKTYMFPTGGNRIAMFYFSADDRAQGPGFDVTVSQHSCDESVKSFEHKIHNEGDHPYRPTTGCDSWLSGEKEVLTSPSHPMDYPPSMRCTYTLSRTSADVCFVRLRFINFDLEQTPDCQSDYLLVEGSNEKLCQSTLTSTEKVLSFPASGQVKLMFNSDGHVSRSGFKILVEQIRNSCVGSHRSGPIPDLPKYYPPVDMPIDRRGPPSSTRVCNRSSSAFLVISSERYPHKYRPSTDCIYRIIKRSNRVCALEVFFQDFSVGTWENNVCTNDYVKIDNDYFCGYRKNERFIQHFEGKDFIDIRFFTDAFTEYPGFVLEIRQVDDCSGLRGLPGSFRSGRKFPVDPMGRKDFPQMTDLHPRMGDATVPPPTGGPFCGSKVYMEEKFDIVSPGYERGQYARFTDCHYTVKKKDFSICALEVTFHSFSLEGSRDGVCLKDFLQIGDDVKICGQLPQQSKRTIEFPSDDLVMKFHTDGDFQDRGFYLSGRQIRC